MRFQKFLYFAIIIASILNFSSCVEDDNVSFDINFKLQYGDEPLVMFEDYTYPTGEKMQFSRYSFYLTNLSGITGSGDSGQDQLMDAAYLDFTNQNVSLEGAQEGITLSFRDLGDVDYGQLSFMIGVDPINNDKTPADFNSSNPLSKVAEYWPGWGSYVFSKTEGKIDFGEAELSPFALHTGGDEAQVDFTVDTEGLGDKGKQTLEVIIDVKKTFGSDSIYDIRSSPAIHSANQTAQVMELVNNLKSSLSTNLK